MINEVTELKDKEKLNVLVGRLSEFINEKNDETAQEIQKGISEDLQNVIELLSVDYNSISKRENDSFLLGYRRAFRIMSREVDKVLVDLKEAVQEENSNNDSKILTSDVIKTLQYQGDKRCIIVKDGEQFGTFGEVWISHEHKVKVLDPYKLVAVSGRRYFSRVVNDFDILD